MTPFRYSLTARGITAAASFALVGGGGIATFGLEPSIAIPIVLLISIGTGIVSLVLGVSDHPGPVAILGIMLPLAFFAFTFALIEIVAKVPHFGWVLMVLGVVPLMMLILSLASPQTVREKRTSAARA